MHLKTEALSPAPLHRHRPQPQTGAQWRQHGRLDGDDREEIDRRRRQPRPMSRRQPPEQKQEYSNIEAQYFHYMATGFPESATHKLNIVNESSMHF
jgi:hypothetical protein